MYPRFLFHKEHAKDGRLIKSAADEPTGDGWVDTPAAFEDGYVAPPPQVDAKGLPAAAPTPGHVHKPYPSHRFNQAGESCLVKTAEEDAALDAAVWKDTPDPAAFADAPPATPPPAPTTPAAPLTGAAAQKADLYAATVATVVEKVAAMTDVAALQLVQGFELTNPKGARKTVLAAVVKRLTELGAGVPDDVKA
jgi:hypothetical protein